MKDRGGHEMRSFLLLVTGLVTALVLAVIIYTTLDSVNRINQDALRAKDNVERSLVDFYVESMDDSKEIVGNPVILGSVDPSLMENMAKGDIAPVLDFITALMRPIYTAEYVVYVLRGDIISSSLKKGIDTSALPATMPEGIDEIQYEVLGEFNGKEGHFFSVYLPFDMPGTKGAYMALLIDRTEEIEAIDAIYEDEKSDLVARQVIIGVVAVALAMLLSMLGVRLLARRYITGPIEELASASHRIMQGEFDGDVQVVEGSDYADIQRLLQSGKVLMDKMMEHQVEA